MADTLSPQVSVIVPVYGVEKYIERCARSILGQTCRDMEIIFVNDCTPDRSMDVLRRVLAEYPDRQSSVHIMEHEYNKGVAGARITGLQAATGKYVLQIDSDDYIALDMVENMLATARKTDADITVCDYTYAYADKERRVRVNPPLAPIECMKRVLTGQLHASLGNKLIKRALYLEHSIMFTQGLNMCEDLSVMYKLFYHARTVAYVPEAYYFYNQMNTASYTAVANIKQAYQESFIVLLRQMDAFRQMHKDRLTPDIEQAFAFYKAQIKAAFWLLGEHLSLVKDDVCQTVALRDILQHPSLPWWFKITGLCGCLHCLWGVKGMRWLYRQGRKLKSLWIQITC